MSFNFEEFKEFQKNLIRLDKERLGFQEGNENLEIENEDDKGHCEEFVELPGNNSLKEEHKWTIDHSSGNFDQNVSVVERLNLSCNEGSLEKKKQSFIDRLVNSENPLTFRSDDTASTMFRYGEYSPNNPHMRVSTAPYLGLGEYEQRKHLLLKQRQDDYKEHINQKNEQIKNIVKKISESRPVPSGQNTKSVQTDLQNIHHKLIQYDPEANRNTAESSPESANSDKENSGIYCNRTSNVQRIDQRLTTAQNCLLADMDKPRSILSNRRTETPREHLLSDYNHGYTCLDGFSYQEKYDEMQRERLKREAYQQELRKQIEEKRRLDEIRLEQERREQDRENRRLEQQLLRMQEEQIREEQRKAIREEQARRSSEEFLRRKQDLLRSGYRKRLESENSTLSLRNTNVASKLSHYSPPVSRRNTTSYNTIPSSSRSYPDTTSPRYSSNRCYNNSASSYSRRDALNRMDSLTINDARDYSRFNRFDSLSRIDSLKQDGLNRLDMLNVNDSLNRVQRRHSATQQDLNMIRRSPKMQRRSSSSRLDDPLPAPVLKAHSPVAQELKNSVAVNSSRHPSSEAKKYDDKWQIPGIQKNIVNHGDLFTEGHGRSILTQLGAIRMQLQREQLRMDETLRQRGNMQAKAVNFH